MSQNTNKSNQVPLVSIKCTVYNHEPFLRQCLDGFVMQKTNFAFEAIVHDDASTDGSAAIIREYAEKYPDIIKPIYETENQYSKKDGSLGRIMNAAIHPDAKYIAICEGDDYWTDPNKLQMQVDFMEAHPECSLTYHACKNEFEDFVCNPCCESVKENYTACELFSYPFQTATTLFLKSVLFSDIYMRAKSVNCMSGDVVLFLSASQLGEIKGLNKQMSVYRRHSGGISNLLLSSEKTCENYIKWVNLANVFKGDIKARIEETLLTNYLFRLLIENKSVKLYLRAARYGLLHSFRGFYLGNLLIVKYWIKTLINKFS